jgi:prepilin-type N-terminal cleavage/methylation domain-containing protein
MERIRLQHGLESPRKVSWRFERQAAGYSLIELMFVVAIFAVLTAAGLSLAVQTQRTLAKGQSASGLLDSGVRAMGLMSREIAMSGWPAPASFSATAVSTYPGIAANSVTAASAYDLVFEADVDGDGIVEQVEYVLPSGSQTLLRSVTKKNPNGTLATSGTVSQPLLDHVQNQTLSQPLFTWQVDPSSSNPFPRNIRTVYINAVLRTTEGAGQGAAALTLSASSTRLNP